MHDGKILILKEGQLITGRKALSEATGISQTTIERILDLFESEHQIGQQKTSKYRVITVLNWKDHQERTAERTSGGHLADTYKNDKKEKNTSESEIRVESFSSEEEESRARPKKVDRSYEQVFAFFASKKQGWMMHKPQIEATRRLLKDKGLEQIKIALDFYREHKDDPYMVEIHTPFDLEAKWSKLLAKSKKV